MNPIQNGSLLYYTGDVANASGWFRVTLVQGHPLRQYHLREVDGGRQTILTGDANIGHEYHGHCDPRYVTQEAYNRYHAEKRAGLQEEPEEQPEPEFNGPWCVCPFLTDRAYGGPEEGGWYYDCGEPQIDGELPVPVFTQVYDHAVLLQQDMQRIMDATVNHGRRSVSSVLSEGVYRAIICEGWPKPYPQHQPHYE